MARVYVDNFCVLCGVLIRPPSDYQFTKRLGWQYEARAIVSESGRLSPSLTGVGYLDSGSFLAPSDANVSYQDKQHTLVKHEVTCAPSWTFIFHDACWQILLDQMSVSSNCGHQLQRIVELLFDHLYCLPYDKLYFPYPSHDCGGALRLLKPHGGLPEEWRFLSADPGYFHLTSSPITFPTAEPRVRMQAYSSAQDFFKLPREIVHSLVSFLASPDLCNLRLSSKYIASLTDPDSLPQTFWKSRFAVDGEMGFWPAGREYEQLASSLDSFTQHFWKSRLEICSELGFWLPGEEYQLASGLIPDWRNLYFKLRNSLQNIAVSGWVRNRRRTWQCLRHLACSMIPIIDQKLHLRDLQSLTLELGSHGYKATQIASGPVVPDGRNRIGIRSFGFQSLLFPSQNLETGFELSISRIMFDGTEYICGLRISKPCRVNFRTEISRAGYIVPESEAHISIIPQHRLSGIRVAISARGIVGLEFCLEDKIGHVTQKAVGIVKDLPEGVGVATLRPQTGFQLSGIIMGLDVCKFVSLQLLEDVIDPATTDDAAMKTVGFTPLLWNPVEPAVGHEVTLPPIPELSKIEPIFLLNMDFGGPEGILLPRLTRIIALHDDNLGCFKGFAFSYTDGSKKCFGMGKAINTASNIWSCIEQSFSIDGPRGEKIVSVEYESELNESHVSDHVGVIKFFTSYGHILSFRRIGRSMEVSNLERRELVSPAATAITAIFAKIEMSSGKFESLGLGYTSNSCASRSLPVLPARDSEDICSYSFPNDLKKWVQAPQSLQNSNGCFTPVLLSDIRRVGLSTGIPGQTRGDNHISGLCFEFWGSTTCIYVGQWFREVDHLMLNRGERISSLTFWQSKEWNFMKIRRESIGRITGIRIETTGDSGNVVETCFGDQSDMISYSFTDNPYEKPTGLAWVFNHECDYIYTTTCPSDHHPDTLLVLQNMTDSLPGSRIPSKLFWQIQDDEAKWCNVSRVHVFFSRLCTKLAGFVFEYGDIKKECVGHLGGPKASITLETGEYVTRMDFGVGNISGDGVIFYTSTGRVHTLSAFGSSHQSIHEKLSNFEVSQSDDLHRSDRTSPEASTVSPSYKSEMVDEFVGIWLTMRSQLRGLNTVEAAGPILAKRGEEKR